MKILAVSKESNYPSEKTFIVEATGEELLRITGRMDALYTEGKNLAVGDAIHVNKAFEVLKTALQAPNRFDCLIGGLKDLTEALRNYKLLHSSIISPAEEKKKEEGQT